MMALAVFCVQHEHFTGEWTLFQKYYLLPQLFSQFLAWPPIAKGNEHYEYILI